MPKGYFIPYTSEEESFIKENYLKLPVKQIAFETNSTYGRIMRFLNKNGLEIPKELVQERILNSRKKKGDIPFNKGMKQQEYMSKEAILKTTKTRFKKGNRPHNTKYDGAIVERADSKGRVYKYFRIREGHWVLYHRYIWEQTNGEIPEGYIIVFKDNNTCNTQIDNLEMISLEENMLRNSKLHYPKEVIPSLVLINQLEKKLKSLENG